ncbi:TetR family transcriptional regulator [Frondihabitans sp. PhB188]|uniref:TetR/AcrR family transcriptional regulator n=1 Tax=Frondihabitans sp. PhB188 TaxID=2485200 RepID=UPI000F959B78|nr:TetR/AcrR family transcriptional regulator [Frondihabitans sp. PhB188]ROQ36756.1 TetR family transcriptional regulator [Frondihabitans sp. PhB188]
MVDARIVQTTKSLHAAIIELASAAPVSTITVADVTRAAGINRATFYSHATSPGGLLADVLTPELDAIRESDLALREVGGHSPEEISRKGMERVVDHVVKYRDIYRLALPDNLDASTHRVLARHFEVSSLLHFENRISDSLPEAISPPLAAGFIAHGLVGVIENWLTGKRTSRKVLVDNIILLLPEWWD